jgi:hypothetical protein
VRVVPGRRQFFDSICAAQRGTSPIAENAAASCLWSHGWRRFREKLKKSDLSGLVDLFSQILPIAVDSFLYFAQQCFVALGFE